jgi:glutaredoxin
MTSSASSTRSSVFYSRTQDALAAQRAAKEASLGHTDNSPTDDTLADTGDDDVSKRLKEAEEAAKKAADRKGEAFHGEAGREKAEQMALKDKQESSNAGAKEEAEDRKGEVKKQPKPETEEQSKVKDELNDILKRSPSMSAKRAWLKNADGFDLVIIFSKTYCPYSRKAKDILLLKYKITPTPFVVELDEHPLGPQLQDELASRTDRRTVPNILINGKSIGGGDDVEKLHLDGDLIEKVKIMGGKRMEVDVVESEHQNRRRRRKR